MSADSEVKPKLKMVEIYGGKDPAWKGWHNLILDLGNPGIDIPIKGPIPPEESFLILQALLH